MKHFSLLFSFFLVTTISFGQITKGNWLVGGSGSLYSYNENANYPTATYNAKYTNIDLSASIGYFPIDKLTLGLRPYLLIEKGSSSGGGAVNSLRLAVGPFARYYLLKEDKQFNLLVDGSYQFGINQESHGDKPKGRFNTLSLMTGVEVFFNSSVGLELLIGYKHQLITFDNNPSAFSSDRKGLQTSIGFHFHLEKK